MGACLGGDHHHVVGSLYFWLGLKVFGLSTGLKVLYFWLDFFNASFLYFGLLVGQTFMTQKHVLPLGCNFFN